MRSLPPIVIALLGGFLACSRTTAAESTRPANTNATAARTFAARGVVEEINSDRHTVLIRHQAISNYMAAMTMPFKVRDAKELATVRARDEVLFALHVTETESWIDQISKIGSVPEEKRDPPAMPAQLKIIPAPAGNPLLDYPFTNELGEAVAINSFRGQALAVTFFYTRCPLPEYCPRLSKNFQSASQKLAALTNAPANWHFLSISFDPEFDSPVMLKAYADSYQSDPRHWSFLTGPPDKIGELARAAGMSWKSDEGTIDHNFRTLIIDAAGHVQMVFPTSGDLSDAIVSEILKAAAVTNQPALSAN